MDIVFSQRTDIVFSLCLFEFVASAKIGSANNKVQIPKCAFCAHFRNGHNIQVRILRAISYGKCLQ